jgi:hypothetical protein
LTPLAVVSTVIPDNLIGRTDARGDLNRSLRPAVLEPQNS